MRLTLAVRGSLRQIMDAEMRAGRAAALAGVTAATQGLKAELRDGIARAGLGRRLGNTWRSRMYPNNDRPINPGGYIWSTAPMIIEVFAKGAKITPTSGKYLAVPLPAAGKRGPGGKRITPEAWERANGQKLRFVQRRGRPSLLVADNARLNKRGTAAGRKGKGMTKRGMTIPIFVLMPQVTIKKRLDIESAVDKWGGRIPTLIEAAWHTSPVTANG